MENGIKLLSVKSIAEKLDCGTTYIEDLAREDESFPKPFLKRGRKFTRWKESDIDAWIVKEASGGGEVHQ